MYPTLPIASITLPTEIVNKLIEKQEAGMKIVIELSKDFPYNDKIFIVAKETETFDSGFFQDYVGNFDNFDYDADLEDDYETD